MTGFREGENFARLRGFSGEKTKKNISKLRNYYAISVSIT